MCVLFLAGFIVFASLYLYTFVLSSYPSIPRLILRTTYICFQITSLASLVFHAHTSTAKRDLKGKGKAVPVVGQDGVPMHVNAAGMSMEVNPPHGAMSPSMRGTPLPGARGAGGVAWAPTAENEILDDVDGLSYTDTDTRTESMWSGSEG